MAHCHCARRVRVITEFWHALLAVDRPGRAASRPLTSDSLPGGNHRPELRGGGRRRKIIRDGAPRTAADWLARELGDLNVGRGTGKRRAWEGYTCRGGSAGGGVRKIPDRIRTTKRFKTRSASSFLLLTTHSPSTSSSSSPYPVSLRQNG